MCDGLYSVLLVLGSASNLRLHQGLFPLVHQVCRSSLDVAGRELVHNVGEDLL